MADADIYKASAAERAAALPSVPNGAATSAAAPPPNPVLRRVLAGAAAAAEAAAAVFGGAAGDAGAPAGSVSVTGLTLPLTAPEQSSAQQQLVMFLRRQLLPLRVAARRIAGAEVWAQHVAEQQQQRQQAAGGAAGDKDEDAELLQGLADGAGAAAQANGTQEHSAVNGLSSDAAAAAAAEVDLGGLQQEVSRVMQQLQPRVAARAEQLLLQQPLNLEDLLGAFQAEALAASQQLNIQVCRQRRLVVFTTCTASLPAATVCLPNGFNIVGQYRGPGGCAESRMLANSASRIFAHLICCLLCITASGMVHR